MVPQLDRAVPLKVRACQGASEGSLAEVFVLGHALCRSNPWCEKSALAARPQIGGNPLDLKLEGIMHSTCRAPVWLVGVKLVGPESGVFDLLIVQYYGGSDSGPLHGCGVDADES